MSRDQQNARILIIGDAGRLFWDYQTRDKSSVCVHHQVLEGIHAAAGDTFTAVAIEIRLVSGRLASVLRAIRKKSNARIILLTQIYEEPIARRQTHPRPGDDILADDYLVCPAGLDWLRALLQTSQPPTDAAASPGLQAMDTLERRIRQLERLATEDDLTGLKNRRYIWEFSRQILGHAAQRQGRVTLLVYDIDDFKQYNDEFGHSVGDRILKEAAVMMRRCCRAHDVIGRIGGDEFAVIFWDDPQEPEDVKDERRTAQVDHPREAVFVAERFQAALQQSDLGVLGTEGKGVLTISGGLASYPEDGNTIQQLFEKADHALLDAKRCGKNRVYIVGQPPAT